MIPAKIPYKHGRRSPAAAILSLALCVCLAANAAPRQRLLLDAGWRFHLNEVDGNSSVAPPGTPVTQWVYIYDNNATNDAATIAAPGLDTSTWTNVTVGTDIFGGIIGFAWYRSIILPSTPPYQPAAIYFSGVDDNGWVYLNGVLIGQHQGWSQPFSVSPLSPAWIAGGTNVLAVAVQNTGGPGGISGPVLFQSGSPQVVPPGIPVTQWLWLSDSNAPNDALVQAAVTLDTSAWQTALIGQDVFNGTSGSGWFRATLDGLASSARPLTLHFLGVNDIATVYLNGALLGRHVGSSLPFDIPVPDTAWSITGPNVLAVAVQDTGGLGGLMAPVILQSGTEVPPPGVPVNHWVWLADSNAPSDASIMSTSNLNTSAWPNAAPAQDLFQGSPGAVWLRAASDPYVTGGQPLILHALGFGSNVTATVYLNGAFLGQYGGRFDVPVPNNAWSTNGPNILAIALQNTNGPAGLLNPLLLQSGDDIQDLSPADPNFNDAAWRTVQLPHDYIVEGTFTSTAETSHASLPLANAWYRLRFPVPVSARGQSVWIDFDGVYHNSTVWINGHYLGYWYSGYAGFRYDISPYVLPGQTNVLTVHVDPHNDEGWWYEGGGIYRHVWLNIANPLHVAPWGTLVTSSVQGPVTNGNASATLTITTTITNVGAQAQSCALVSQVVGPDGVTAGTVTTQATIPGGTGTNLIQTLPVANAHLWSLDIPQLYELQTSIQQNGQPVDTVNTPFGIRSIFFDVNNGFFLNGQRVEIKGMCNHQDFAGVGIGMPDNLLYWRVKQLKQMGANAYRCSHNPPAEALLDACDQLGMLVMDENRHLGDSTGGYSSATAQTTYADLSPLNSMIQRDRNHPSIIIWSMCNEEAISGTQAGADIFRAMKERVQEFDTSRPVSCAMNSGWFNIGISLVEDVEGFNYSPGEYDSFHQTFPAQPMYGSETSVAETDRGMYASDGVAYVSAYTSTPESAWQPVATQPFMAGAFLWTGFDYKGEPSPYGWPCISSKFGTMDSCGLPKDDYYYYQAWWGSQHSVHILPHWNWSSSQTVAVWCYANTASVELFLNGVSQGLQTMPAHGHVAWSLPYAAGTLLAKGYDSTGAVVATNQVVTTGSPAAISLTTDRSTLTADGEDLTVVYASILDAQGRVVPTASNQVSFSIDGPASVAGVGNGDPASHEPDRASQRYAFNGWCMALVSATNSAGPISLTANSPGLTPATLSLQANPINGPPATPTNLTVVAGNAQASLHWDLAFNATSYNVKRATVSGGPYTTVANYTAVGFKDTGLGNGTTYYYVVSSVNAYGESANSTEVSVVPISPTAPSTPTGLSAQRDDCQVILSWNATAGPAAYNVQRAIASAGPYALIASITTNNYVDTGLTNGTTYYYVVSAVNSGLQGANSAAVNATPASMSYLVSSSIGTTGSWSNVGNVREMALDMNLETFFDSPTNTGWAGLDLGTNNAKAICKILYAPRIGYEYRMVGGVFQGANQPDLSDAVALYTITNTPPDGWTTVFLTNTAAFRYLAYQGPANSYGNIAEMAFYSLGPHCNLLTGTIIGTSGSWNNDGDTIQLAMDGNIQTFFDAPAGTNAWVGLDLGSAMSITALRFFPRVGYEYRMAGGVFQGANQPDFSDAVAFGMITNTPPDAWTALLRTNATAFRYVRYLSPTNGYGNVSEVQFFGPSVGVPAPPSSLTATLGNAEIALSWTGSLEASSYNVKRATVSGGPYTNIASQAPTIYMDFGLAGGTYYYVVSAMNAGGESANSPEVGATLGCLVPPIPSGLALTARNGQVLLAWMPSSTGTSPTLYNVLRSTSGSGPYVLLATDEATTNYCDDTAASGVGYYYSVQAVNSCGQSADSAALGITSLPMPHLNASLNGAQLQLSWPSWAGDFQAYGTTNLAEPASWQPLVISPQSSNGTLYLVLPTTNGPQQFFRLVSP
jgi:beta-galactosidase